MSQNTILLLQSIGITLQMVNGGLGSTIKDPVVSLVIAAVIGGFQFYVQHVGNQSTSPTVQAQLDMQKNLQGGK